MGKTIRSYDYVNHRYEAVRDTITKDPVGLFRAATKSASSRAEAVAVALRVDIAGVEVSKDVVVAVKRVTEEPAKGKKPPRTVLTLEWEAAKSPRLFPFMQAELAIYPLTATETQLDLDGEYEPPLGPLGKALDKLMGHRIAEACVKRFLEDVADHLRRKLGKG
jgi:hypothetical protein